jgi:hypothetical protein
MRIPAGRLFVGLLLLSSSSVFAVCNHAPVANTDVYNMAKNTTLSIYDGTLKNNDTDADGDALTSYISGAPSTGSWCGVAPDGYCYQPPTNFTGLVSIPYSVTDGCNTVGGTVLIYVQ